MGTKIVYKKTVAAKNVKEQKVGDIVHKRTIAAKNVKEQKVGDMDIYKFIDKELQLYRVSQNIQLLRNAITYAENIQSPQRWELQRIYIDTLLDTHVLACIDTYKNLILGREFNFYKQDGGIDEEASKLVKTKWFRDFAGFYIEKDFWGHSLVQLGDVTEYGFKQAELIPRWYVKPELNIVTSTYSALTGENYTENGYENWVLPCGDKKYLGMLMEISFHAIWKKTAIASWAEFALGFGTPAIVLKTSTKDKDTMSAQDKLMKQWASSQRIIADKQDEIDFLESKRTDAHAVFAELIKQCNDEISKRVLGGTGIMEEKAHVGSADIHQNNLIRIRDRVTFDLEDYVNTELKRVLVFHGFKVADLTFKVTDNTDVGEEAKKTIDLALIASPKYKLNVDYIKETYGSDVEEVEVQPEISKSFKNSLDNFYGIS
jgi:hypothetical protein